MIANRESVAQALEILGYSVNSSWKFKLRDERTPSASIDSKGKIHDYGSGFHGDVANVLQEYHNFSTSKALEKMRELLDMPITRDFSHHIKTEISSIKNIPIDEKYLLKFTEERRLYFEEYSKLLKGLLPSVKSPDQRKEIALKYEIGFSKGFTKDGNKYPSRLIMPIRDEKGRIITLWKYNPFLKPQEKLRYTKNRNRYAFNIRDLLNYQNNLKEIVYICEGEKDVLNAIAYGLRAITPGSAAHIFEEKQIPLFKDLHIVVLGDNDSSGKKFNDNIEAQLTGTAKSIKKFSWEEHLKPKGVTPSRGFDLTDWLTMKNNEEL